MPDEQPIEWVISVEMDDADAEELNEQTRQLMREILELPVDSARLVTAGEAPAGSKAIDMVQVGQVAVALLPLLLPKLVELVASWTDRSASRRVKFRGVVAGQKVVYEGSVHDLKILLKHLDVQQKPGAA